MKKGLWTALSFCAISCLVSLYLGQDNNYDLKGYHLYNPWAMLSGRWSQDLFAAGPATFFPPFLDVPYYLVATQLFPSHGAIVVALAGLPYGVLLYFIYLISARIASSLELGKWDRVAFMTASLLLAGTGAATWSEIGTTFNDITITAMVLAAFHLILGGVIDREEEPSPRRVAVAGMLLGLATGLKLTAAIYVPSMAVVILLVGHGWRKKIRSLVIYGGCAFAVFVVIYGPWGWKLYELTGNPFFPLLNGVFHSDWMASINARDVRFLPRSWLQGLFYPFYWTTRQSLVTEVPFRDPRLAVAYVFLAGYVAIALTNKDLRTKLFFGKYKPVHALVLFVAVSYILWMHEFSIFRYLMVTECLAGVFIVVGIMALARKLGPRAAWIPALCVISIAGVIIGYSVSPQWGRAPLGTDIWAVEAPALEQGALVIFADDPMSFLAPGLAATSRDLRFMTIPRWFAVGGNLGAQRVIYGLERRMKAKIAENTGPLYVLFNRSEAPPEPNMAAFDVEMDMASCRPGRSSLGPEFLACRGTHRKGQPAISR